MSELGIQSIKLDDIKSSSYRKALNRANSHEGRRGYNDSIDTNEEATTALSYILPGLKIEEIENSAVQRLLRKEIDTKSPEPTGFNDIIDPSEVPQALALLVKHFGGPMRALAWIVLNNPESTVAEKPPAASTVDLSEFTHRQIIRITSSPSANWKKVGLTATPHQGGIRISGSLPGDCDNFTWIVAKKLPIGKKYLTIDVAFSAEAGTWGNRAMFGLQINGKTIKPINASAQADGMIDRQTGRLIFSIDEFEEIQTISIKTFAGKNISLNIKDITVLATTDKVKINPPTFACQVNQVGYLSSGKKQAVVTFSENNLGLTPVRFIICEKSTGRKVYEGNSSSWRFFAGSGQTVSTLDFTEFTKNGDYVIKIPKQEGVREEIVSFDFSIKRSTAELYGKIRDDALRAFVFWKCGDDGVYSCHAGDKYADVHGQPGQKIDVRGGWHDAGDYGKYSVNAAYTVGMLFLGLESFPNAFNFRIPGTGKGKVGMQDILRPEIEWFFSMQRQDGAVYHKACSKEWPLNETSPERDAFIKTVLPVSTTATADFAAIMAQASRAFSNTDPELSRKCLDAAERAWQFLEKNPALIMVDPTYDGKEYGGPYIDERSDDKDERLWAAAELWRATHKEKYGEYVKQRLPKPESDPAKEKILDWGSVSFFAYYSYFMDNPSENPELKSYLQRYGDYLLQLQSRNPFGITITGRSEGSLDWGSNSVILTGAFQLLMTSKLSGDPRYGQQARSSLDYVLGINPLGYSFVTGNGDRTPKDPHFRPSMSGQHLLPSGFLIGGPNSVEIGGDVPLAAMSQKPPYLRYVDDRWSWATNEVAVNWNAPLVNVLAVLASY